MISNFERLQEIQKQANSESYSSLSHVEPRSANMPQTGGQDDLVLLYFIFYRSFSVIYEKQLFRHFRSQ